MSKNTQTKTASVTPEVYASQDVPGNFGFVGCDSDQYETLRQVTVAEYGTFFALKNGSDTLATSPIKEPLVALANAYNHAEKLAEALDDISLWLGRSARIDDQEMAADARKVLVAYLDEREAQ